MLHNGLITDSCTSYQFDVCCSAFNISELRNKVDDILSLADMPHITKTDVICSIGEALTNALKHGSPFPRCNKIHLHLEVCKLSIKVSIEDEGCFFDPDTIPPHDLENHQEGGMGINIMTELMDEIKFYDAKPGCGVWMKKTWIENEIFPDLYDIDQSLADSYCEIQ